jgi:membrane protease YdiL (CAAX protease family)
VEEQNEEYGPEGEEPQVEPGLFDSMNNWFLLIYAFACFMMASSLVGILYLNGNVVLSVILPAIFGYILPLAIITRRYNLSFIGEFRLSVPDATTTALVIIIAAAAIYPVDALSWFFRRGRQVDSDYIEILLAFKPKGALHLIGMAVGLGLITPLGEELLYRGTIQAIFHRNMTAIAAILVSALVFALSHGVLYLIPGVTLLGIILAYVFYRTGSLIYTVMIHSIFNLFSLYRLNGLSEDTIREFEWSAPSVGWLVATSLILLFVLVIFNRHTAHRT